jgi:hypothetical protein
MIDQRITKHPVKPSHHSFCVLDLFGLFKRPSVSRLQDVLGLGGVAHSRTEKAEEFGPVCEKATQQNILSV